MSFGVTKPQCVNSSGFETKMFQANYVSTVNTIVDDALAPCIARSSAKVVTIHYTCN